MKAWLIIVGLVVAVAAAARGDHGDEGTQQPIMISVYSDADGTAYELSVTPDQLAATPEWSGLGEPPLSVGAACEVAAAWLKGKYVGFAEFEPENLTLNRVFHESVANRWSYSLLINAYGVLGGVKVKNQFMVVVLMDRSVVEPKPYQSEESADSNPANSNESHVEN